MAKKKETVSPGMSDKTKLQIGAALVLGAIAVVVVSVVVSMRKDEAVAAPQPSAPQAAAPVQVLPSPEAGADLAPDFALKEVATGKTFRLSEQRGKVVLLDFWATWCGPCRMAIPHLIELQKEYGKKGFTLVGVSLDQQGEAVVAPFYKQWNMNYPVVIDRDGSTARNYGGIRSIPTAVLVDKRGKIVNGFVGYRPKEVFEEAIKVELAKK